MKRLDRTDGVMTKETPEMTRLYVGVLLDRKKAKSER